MYKQPTNAVQFYDVFLVMISSPVCSASKPAVFRDMIQECNCS